MKITIVFKDEWKETVHTTIKGFNRIQYVDTLIREKYSGVLYWAVSVDN